MSRTFGTRVALSVLALCLTSLGAWCAFGPTTEPAPKASGGGPGAGKETGSRAGAGAAPADPLEGRFSARVRPFLARYCFSCHGPKKHKAGLDLGRDSPAAS